MRVSIISALLFTGVLTVFQALGATASATATATVISPTDVASDATAVLLKRAGSGVFILRIPNASGSSSNSGDKAVREMTLSSIWGWGSSIVISTSDSTPPVARLLALATSGGDMNSILSSGLGVNLVITHVEEDGTGRGNLYAIIVYN